MDKLASGIFLWDGSERRSSRYGSVTTATKTADEKVVMDANLDLDVLFKYGCTKVKMIARVIETRQSSHMGDRYLDIFPSTPNVGDEFVLGIGLFRYKNSAIDSSLKEFAIFPSDGRDIFWMDPRTLYKLHDQTVELYLEETTEDELPAPDIPLVSHADAISNGDGSLQMRHLPEGDSFRVKPNMQKIGDGLFLMNMPNAEGNAGEEFELST